jgi:ribosome-associated heat shock protein Hsp15
MRIDRLLFVLRFARSRTLAQRWIAEGHIRRNGERVTRQDLPVAVGDVLTLPLKRAVLVIELLALPERRGPTGEARACYRQLDAGLDGDRAKRIAGGEPEGAEAPRPEGKAEQ